MWLNIFLCLQIFHVVFPLQEHFETLSHTKLNETIIVKSLQKILSGYDSLYKIAVFIKTSSDFEITEILKSSKVPYNIMTHFILNSYATTTFDDNFLFVLCVDSAGDAVSYILEAITSRQLAANSKILVILAKNQPEQVSRYILKQLWDHFIGNVIIYDAGAPEATNVYAYNPYGRKFSKQLTTGSDFRCCEDTSKNLFGDVLHVILFKIVPNAFQVVSNGRSIWVGDAFEMAALFAEYSNATLLKTIDEDTEFGFEIFLNETFSHVSEGVSSQVAASFNSITLQRIAMNSSFHFDFIYPQESFKKMIALVPKAGRVPFYLVLFTNSKQVIGYGFLCSFVIVTLTLKIVLRMLDMEYKVEDLLLKVFAIAMTQDRSTTATTYTVSLILMVWDLFCMVLFACVSGEIIKSMVVPVYGRDIDSPHEALNDSLWNFYAFDGYVYVIASKKMKLNTLVEERVKGLSKNDLYAKALNCSGNDAFIVAEAVADYIIARVEDDCYHKTEELFNDLHSLYVKRGSPFFKTLSSFSEKVCTSGLLQFWERRAIWRDHHYSQQKSINELLSFGDFVKISRILGVGFGISVIAFVYENFRFYYRTN